MILIFFHSYFPRLPPKTITYRSFRYFKTKDFLYELQNKLSAKECNGRVKYDDLMDIFRSTLDSHAPLKQKKVRGNQTPFMTKAMSKAIITRSRMKNKCNKWSSREKFLDLKQITNKRTNLTKTAKKQYFAKSTENQLLTNKIFWNSISQFLTNKKERNDDVITLNGNSTRIDLGPLLFNIFINDLIGFIKKSSLYYFADDNTIAAFEKDITLLKETLQNEAEIAIQWFKDKLMIVNPGKFQAMVTNRFGKMENKHEMYIENKKITSEHSVKLLGIEIDNQLKFDNHVSTLC